MLPRPRDRAPRPLLFSTQPRREDISMYRASSPGQLRSSWQSTDLPSRVFLLPLLLVALGTTACGPKGKSEGSQPKSEESTIVVAYSIDIEGVNELITQPTPIHMALHYFALFLPLLEEQADYQEGPPSFTPRLAESYEISADGLQITLRLRPDVQWSDGVPVTAEDVRWTWQAQVSPGLAWNYADSKSRIRDVEVVDAHTVIFHFTEAYPSQVLDMNVGVILPKHAWGELPFAEWRDHSDWFLDHLVTNGPFVLESWAPQQRFVLARNPNYFEPGVPKVDRIVFEVTREPQAQLAKLLAQQADLVEFLAPSDIATVEAADFLRVESYIPRFFYFVTWNISRPLFQDTRVRQALTMAIDRQAIIDSLYYGYASPSHSPFASDIWAHNKDLEPWPYDPTRAKALLAEAGWIDRDGDGILDKDGQPFQFELLTNSENQVRRDIVVMIQQMLGQIGIGAQPRLMEFNALIGPLSSQDFDAAVSGLAMDTSLNTRFFFHTEAIDGGYNWGAFSDPRIDQLIVDIEGESDAAAAKRLFDELQVILHQEQPITLLYQGLRSAGVNRRLLDYNPNAINSFFNMRGWRLSDE